MPDPITILFDPDAKQPFTFDPETRRVPQGRHQIMFHLKTAGGGAEKARFDEQDGVFIKGGEGVFETKQKADFQWIELDDNRTKTARKYPYKVTVIYKGEKLSSPDPFILNEPPL